MNIYYIALALTISLLQTAILMFNYNASPRRDAEYSKVEQ
jgi:hypothetical protein